MSNRKRLYLMDGTQFAYRAYFAFIKQPLRNSKGMNVSAPYGMLNSILKVIEYERPDAFAVAFDVGKPLERMELYPEYKSTRDKMPDEMRDSLPYIHKLVEAMCVPIIEKDGVEADDLMGTIAKRAVDRGWDVVLVTGDKDLLQLVDEHISILAPSKGALPTEWYTVENAHKRFDVPPKQIIDFLALMGDSADNIPGVKGIGKKTAARLLAEYESFEDIYEHLDDIGGSTAEKLKSDREIAELSRKLVTIDTDVECKFDWENATVCKPDYKKLIPILEELEFNNLLDKFYKEAGDEVEKIDTGKIEYNLVKSKEDFDKLVKLLESAERISVDTETTCEEPMLAELVGISFSVESDKAFYIPVGHRHPGEMFISEELNLPKSDVISALRPILEAEKPTKVGQNIKYDYTVLHNEDIVFHGIDGDTMLADYLLAPSAYEHGLDVLSMKHLGHRMMTYKELTKQENGKQLSIAEISPERVARYSGEDADIAFKIALKLEPELERLKLDKLYKQLEVPLITVLGDMEIAGVGLNTKFLEVLSEKLKSELSYIESEIYSIAGEKFNIGSPKQLSEILFDKLGLPPQKKTKTGYSTDAEVLQILARDHDLPAKIIKHRELSKLISTYIDALPTIVNPETGRIHPSFQQAVTSTGRLSCRDPNLQNIPVRGETGREIRKAFVPAKGNLLLSADYSQIELRIMAHISGDEAFRKSFAEGKDIHAATASRIFGVPESSVTPQQRRMAKVINFGVIYGMTAYGVSGRLEIDISEAKEFVDAYFARHPGVAKYMEEAPKKAAEFGYVETIMGRRRYLPELKEGGQAKKIAQRAAINTPIQGSAADLIKVAMLKIHKRLEKEKLKAKMILTVHDELVFDTPQSEVEKVKSLVKEIMESAMKLSVPLVVDIGVGEDWLSAHE